MKVYRVPLQLEKEEKLFGGSITLRQMIYLIVGVGFGAMIFAGFYRIHLVASLLAWVIFAVIACVFAFYKVKEVDIDKYLIMLVLFKLRRKEYPYGGGR